MQARSRSPDPCSNAGERTPLFATAALAYAGTVTKTISEDDVESIEWRARGSGAPGHQATGLPEDALDVGAAALHAALNGKP